MLKSKLNRLALSNCFGSFVALAFLLFFSFSNIQGQSYMVVSSGQSGSPSAEIEASQFKAAADAEIEETVKETSGYSKIETTIRLDILTMTKREVSRGVSVIRALNQSVQTVKLKLHERNLSQSVDLKNILREYENKFL